MAEDWQDDELDAAVAWLNRVRELQKGPWKMSLEEALKEAQAEIMLEDKP